MFFNSTMQILSRKAEYEIHFAMYNLPSSIYSAKVEDKAISLLVTKKKICFLSIIGINLQMHLPKTLLFFLIRLISVLTYPFGL